MSTISDPQAPRASRFDAERFRYGWRYVRRDLPDGSVDWDQVPLTLEDVLHPQMGDVQVLSRSHGNDCNYLKDVFEARLAGDPSAVVFWDTGVKWDVPELRHHSPDIAVILGVRRQRDWSMFDVTEEGVRPALIVEVTSPASRVNDVVTKVDHYYRAGVPHYVIVDAREVGDERRLSLIAYRHAPGEYERVFPDDRGWLWLEPVGLWLGIAGDRVACYDGVTGEQIGDYTTICQARAAAEAQAVAEAEARAVADARAAAESEARAAAEVRIRELEAELRRLRGEA